MASKGQKLGDLVKRAPSKYPDISDAQKDALKKIVQDAIQESKQSDVDLAQGVADAAHSADLLKVEDADAKSAIAEAEAKPLNDAPAPEVVARGPAVKGYENAVNNTRLLDEQQRYNSGEMPYLVAKDVGTAVSDKVLTPLGDMLAGDPKTNKTPTPEEIAAAKEERAAKKDLKVAASLDADIGGMGGGPADKPQKNWGEDMAAADQVLAQQQIISANARVEATKHLADAQLEMKRIDDQHAADILQSEQVRQARESKYKDHIASLEADIAKLDPTIDNTRYWKNKSAGQVALGALAGALFGFAGKGMDYLNSIQREIDADVEAQKATYENADKRLQRQISAEKDRYAMARESGLSEREATAAAYAAKARGIIANIEAVKTQGLGVEQQAAADEMIAGMQSRYLGKLQEGAQEAAKQANLASATELARTQAWAARENVRINKIKALLKASGGGLKVSSAEKKELQSYDDFISTLEAMKGLADAPTGKKLARVAMNATPEILKAPAQATGASGVNVPGVGSMDQADADNDTAVALNESFMRGLTGAAVQKNDEIRTQAAKLNPRRLGGAESKKVDALLALTKKKRAEFVSKLGATAGDIKDDE